MRSRVLICVQWRVLSYEPPIKSWGTRSLMSISVKQQLKGLLHFFPRGTERVTQLGEDFQGLFCLASPGPCPRSALWELILQVSNGINHVIC